jgi:hypothetical protein
MTVYYDQVEVRAFALFTLKPSSILAPSPKIKKAALAAFFIFGLIFALAKRLKIHCSF